MIVISIVSFIMNSITALIIHAENYCLGMDLYDDIIGMNASSSAVNFLT